MESDESGGAAAAPPPGAKERAAGPPITRKRSRVRGTVNTAAEVLGAFARAPLLADRASVVSLPTFFGTTADDEFALKPPPSAAVVLEDPLAARAGAATPPPPSSSLLLSLVSGGKEEQTDSFAFMRSDELDSYGDVLPAGLDGDWAGGFDS